MQPKQSVRDIAACMLRLKNCKTIQNNRLLQGPKQYAFKKMCLLETSLMAVIWNRILERFQATSESLQSYNIDIGTGINLNDSLANFLTSIRSDVEFSQIEDEAKKLSHCQKYKAARSRQRKYAKLFHDDPSGNNSIENQSPSRKFKVQTYYAILDKLVNELRRRRAAYEDFYQKFEVFSRFDVMSSIDIIKYANRLIDSSPEIDTEFPDELVHFVHFLSTRSSQLPQDAMQLLRANHLSSTYPNVDIALRIYLCNFATNATGERTFSALKRVKNELRTTVAQGRMSALSLLCIENVIVDSLQLDDIIDEYAKQKARRMPIL